MSRYISDRPCPVHGVPVERYIRDNRCFQCHAAALKRSAAKRYALGAPCRRCGGTNRHPYDGKCITCQEQLLKDKQRLPCSICGCINRDPGGWCRSCGISIYGRKVPLRARPDLLALIKAINMQYGVHLGNHEWGGIIYDGKHYEIITKFINKVNNIS